MHVYRSYKYHRADFIQPQCMDADPTFQQCDSGQLEFNEELTFRTGRGQTINVTRYEQLEGRYRSLRPVYGAMNSRYSSTVVYLYHADGQWRLNTNYRITSTSAFARVNDTALRPEFITGVWEIRHQGCSHHVNRKLRCSGMLVFNFYHNLIGIQECS